MLTRRPLEREVRTACVDFIEAAPVPWHYDDRASQGSTEGSLPKLQHRMLPPP
jgi:hypothetical protein